MNVVPRESIANHFLDHVHGEQAIAVVNVALNYLLFEDTADKPIPTQDPLDATFGEYKAQF
jgi:hypothetical protein